MNNDEIASAKRSRAASRNRMSEVSLFDKRSPAATAECTLLSLGRVGVDRLSTNKSRIKITIYSIRHSSGQFLRQKKRVVRTDHSRLRSWTLGLYMLMALELNQLGSFHPGNGADLGQYFPRYGI